MRVLIAVACAIALLACEAQRVEYFPITIIANTDSLSTAHHRLPGAIRSLANYYRDSACFHRVFVPIVTIRRVDLIPERADSVADPLSAVNRWRRRIHFLPTSHVMSDYDRGWRTLVLPSMLASRSDRSVSAATLRQRYPAAAWLPIDDSLESRTSQLRDDIRKRLCAASSPPAFAILFFRGGVN